MGNLILPFPCLAGNSTEVFFTSYEKTSLAGYFLSELKSVFLFLLLNEFAAYLLESNVPESSR